MTRPKIIVVTEFVGDVVVVSPRSFDRVRGLTARKALIDERLVIHPKYQDIMNAITPCVIAHRQQPHPSSGCPSDDGYSCTSHESHDSGEANRG